MNPRIRLEVPAVFREHHRTEIVGYAGPSGYTKAIYDKVDSAATLQVGGDDPDPWHSEIPDLPRFGNYHETDPLLLLPLKYPPHDPVMDDCCAHGGPKVEAEWKRHCFIYREDRGYQDKEWIRAVEQFGVDAREGTV